MITRQGCYQKELRIQCVSNPLSVILYRILHYFFSIVALGCVTQTNH